MDNYIKTVLIAVAFFICYSSTCYGNTLCSGKNETLICLKDNFKELYLSNYHLFWNILNTAEKKAIGCKSISDTASFIELAATKGMDGEVAEYYNEVIEKLIIKNPKCLLDALSILNAKAVSQVIFRLQHPLFTEQSAIDEIFRKNKHVKKYKTIMTFYFGAGK